jgi:hypothetical protein
MRNTEFYIQIFPLHIVNQRVTQISAGNTNSSATMMTIELQLSLFISRPAEKAVAASHRVNATTAYHGMLFFAR